MSKPEVLEKTPMNVVEVKQELSNIQKSLGEDEELNFRAAKTFEYGEDFARLKPKQAQELYEKLQALDIPRMREIHIQKLIDILPTSEKHAKIILGSYHLTVTNENVKKVVSTIKEYA